jgi:3-methyladenine DNA glycosylase/8-oxoguanine DNA glycosylase
VQTRVIPWVVGPVDLARSWFPLRRGTGDPTTRVLEGEVWRAARTPEGPATAHLRAVDDSIVVRAWGAGADWILDHAPAMAGIEDDPGCFRPQHQVLRDLRRHLPGLRLVRTDRIMEALIPAILEQKVTGTEARRAWRRLVRATSEPAPGDTELFLPPDPERVSTLPAFRFHAFGVERRRAERIRWLCACAPRLERIGELHPPDAREALLELPGVGVWTAAEVARLAMGDPDAVSVGDFHLPHLVAWALAGEPRGTDERMLELLEPYRGQRARVQVLFEAGGITAPRFGPRMEPHAIERI